MATITRKLRFDAGPLRYNDPNGIYPLVASLDRHKIQGARRLRKLVKESLGINDIHAFEAQIHWEWKARVLRVDVTLHHVDLGELARGRLCVETENNNPGASLNCKTPSK